MVTPVPMDRLQDLIRLPGMFYWDHAGRDLPTPDAVQENARSVWVRPDDPNLPELLDDARYYAEEMRQDCPEYAGAAQRLLAAHARQTTPTP